jgi:hypothetical protein
MKLKFSIQFSYENNHTPRLISKIVRAGETVNTDFESAAQNLSTLHVRLLDEFYL